MMLGVLSDTHGGREAWRRAAPLLGEAALLIHCGDAFYAGTRNPQPDGYAPGGLADDFNRLSVPFLMVRGNCDADVDLAVLAAPVCHPHLFCELDGLRIVAMHGHLLSDGEYLGLGRRWGARVLLSGHTHRPRLETGEGILLCNPGSPALPKDRPTVALIDTGPRRARLLSVPDGRALIEASF